MKLLIKNMVCQRCKMAVESELVKMGIINARVELGEVEIDGHIPERKYEMLKNALFEYGLELMSDKKEVLVERIKLAVIDAIHNSKTLPKLNFSEHLSRKLNYNYTYLSNVFSKVSGGTLEQFIITHRIERAKELLACGDLTLTEIAWKLQYSSVAHLSNQFKKVTGSCPSQFKKLKDKKLVAIEDL